MAKYGAYSQSSPTLIWLFFKSLCILRFYQPEFPSYPSDNRPCVSLAASFSSVQVTKSGIRRTLLPAPFSEYLHFSHLTLPNFLKNNIYLPAMNHDRATKKVAESINSASEFEKKMWILRDSMVWPACELDMSDVSSSCPFSSLEKVKCSF